MGQDFYRRVVGYNDWHYTYYGASISRNNVLVFTVSGGPGQLERLMVRMADINTSNPKKNVLEIYVDGVKKSSGWIDDEVGGIGNTITYGVPCTSWVTPTYTYFDINHVIDFRSTIQFRLNNTFSPDPCEFYMYAWYKVGL